MAMTVLLNAGPWLAVPPPTYGGIENVVAALVPELRRRGVRVVLATVGASSLPVDRKVVVFDDGQFPLLQQPYNQVAGIAAAHLHAVVAQGFQAIKIGWGPFGRVSAALDEAIVRARKIIEEKSPEMEEAQKAEVARMIGIGAVKYADLSQYRMTDYIFSWDRMLSFQGNTAPYLQNAYVRIQSIFRKGGDSKIGKAAITLAEPAEKLLAKRLCQFAEIVPTVLNDFRPNVLANYLFELANSFHAFYEACPVLKSEEPTRSSRLALCELTARVLRRGLDLLGIEVPEKM